MILEMNAKESPKWVEDFQDKLITEFHINKIDSIFICGEMEKILRKHIRSIDIQKIAKEYMMNTYGANIDAPGQCSQSTKDKYESYINGFKKLQELI